jgi:Trimethylamine:corrinoid methyltransferase
MKTRKGLPGGQYKPLTDDAIIKIHKTVLRVFNEVGIDVRLAEARELFRNAGAKVDETTNTVKIPPGLVEELIGKAPSDITLYGRAEKRCVGL